jgi:hypothetical protein
VFRLYQARLKISGICSAFSSLCMSTKLSPSLNNNQLDILSKFGTMVHIIMHVGLTGPVKREEEALRSTPQDLLLMG